MNATSGCGRLVYGWFTVMVECGRMSTRSFRSRTGLLVAGVVMISACSGGSSPSDLAGPSTPPTDTEPSEVEATANEPAVSEPVITDVEVEELVARCGNPDGAGAFVEVDCAQAHVAEFTATVALPAGVDPSLEPVDDPALHRACIEQNRAVLGDHPARDFLDADFVVDEGADTVDCWISNTANILTGSIAGIGLAAALGDVVFVDEVAAGSCFRLVADQFTFVEPADCSQASSDAEIRQQLGVAVLADGQYPGSDPIADLAIDACLAVIEATTYDVEIAPTFVVLTPSEIGWTVYDQRSATCIGEELGTLGDDGTGAASPCAGLGDEGFVRVDCAEPHAAEFVGLVDSPVALLPDDSVEASDVLMAACRPAVESFLGTSVSLPGFGVGFASDDGPGETVENPIECYVTTGSSAALVGSIAELGAEAALNDLVIVRELNPGDCFVLDDENFSLGQPAECTAPEALVHIGTFELDDGPHLGDGPIREIRFERCSAISADSGIAADPASISGTFPNEEVWRRFDRRLVTCDATPR